MKKTNREFNWKIYVTGFVITSIIFSVGIFVGLQIESEVSSQLIQNIEQTKQKISAVETMLILEDSPVFCEFFAEEVGKFDAETSELGQKIGYMEERKNIDPELKIAYMTLELRDYLLVKKINERCNQNTTLILYFLSSNDCKDCRNQGTELTKAREENEIRVYSFDSYVNSSVARALIKSYDITSYPSLVINENKYEGLMNKEQILKIINKSNKE